MPDTYNGYAENQFPEIPGKKSSIIPTANELIVGLTLTYNDAKHDQHNRVTYIMQGLFLGVKEFPKHTYTPFKIRYGLNTIFDDETEKEISEMNLLNSKIANYEGNIGGMLDLIGSFLEIVYGGIQEKLIETKNNIKQLRELQYTPFTYKKTPTRENKKGGIRRVKRSLSIIIHFAFIYEIYGDLIVN